MLNKERDSVGESVTATGGDEKDERQRGRYVAAVGTAGTVLGLLLWLG